MQHKQTPQDEQFEALALRHADQMFRVAYSRIGNRADAQDIVQETFLRAYKGFNSFSGETDFRNWLMRILINSIRDHFRKSARTVSTVDITDVSDESMSVSDRPGPEDTICAEEIDPALIEALSSMPDQFVIALLLREIDDASYEEIAKILDVPKGTVMSRLFRAREMLRKKLLAKPDDTDNGAEGNTKVANKDPRGSDHEM